MYSSVLCCYVVKKQFTRSNLCSPNWSNVQSRGSIFIDSLPLCCVYFLPFIPLLLVLGMLQRLYVIFLLNLGTCGL